AGSVFVSVTQVKRSNAEVMEERRVVGPGTQGADPKVGTLAKLIELSRSLRGSGRYHRASRARPCVPRVGDAFQLEPLPNGYFLLRVLDIARDLVDEFLQRVGAGGAEVAPAVRV